MTRAEMIRRLPKTGWRNRMARLLFSLHKQSAPTLFAAYQTKTRLRLPFEGEWYVYWGGRSLARNKHAVASDQRFAYDFLIVKGRHSFAGTGERNEDYFCFGLPVVSPAPGVVARAIDGLPDNVPGEMNVEHPIGNHIILDHGNGEFSFLAHLKGGSLQVHAQERVASGAVVGHCGNSGNSSEPHLHFHLQNTGLPFRGEALPAFFCHYLWKGKIIARGEPIAGQTISPAQ